MEKIARELYVAAKGTNGDPADNPNLRLVVEKAKSNNMPKDNIQKAIDKASGNMDGANYENVRYEGYGHGGFYFSAIDATSYVRDAVIRYVKDAVSNAPSINNIPVILRPGGITPKMIQEVIGVVEVDKHILGKIEEGETKLDAAIRECHEELGEKAIFDESKFRFLMDFDEIASSDPNLKIHMNIFVYDGELTGEFTTSEEIGAFMWFGKDDDTTVLSNTLKNEIIPYCVEKKLIY